MWPNIWGWLRIKINIFIITIAMYFYYYILPYYLFRIWACWFVNCNNLLYYGSNSMYCWLLWGAIFVCRRRVLWRVHWKRFFVVYYAKQKVLFQFTLQSTLLLHTKMDGMFLVVTFIFKRSSLFFFLLSYIL